jgi:hypothetical protein
VLHSWGHELAPREWGGFCASLRPALRKVARVGGDPDFVLFVLVAYRFRAKETVLGREEREAADVLRVIDRVEKAGGSLWIQVGAEMNQIRARIREALWVEEGALDREMVPTRRRRSHRMYRCLYVLNEYLKKALPPRKTSREDLLVQIVDASAIRCWDEPTGWVPDKSQSGEKDVEFVRKRLRRARRQVHLKVGRWTRAYQWESRLFEYHEFRKAAGLECGLACRCLPTDRPRRRSKPR